MSQDIAALCWHNPMVQLQAAFRELSSPRPADVGPGTLALCSQIGTVPRVTGVCENVADE